MKAASQGDLVAVQSLLAAGAEAGARGRDGRTPLICAAIGGWPEIAEALLEGACLSRDGRREGEMNSKNRTEQMLWRERLLTMNLIVPVLEIVVIAEVVWLIGRCGRAVIGSLLTLATPNKRLKRSTRQPLPEELWKSKL